MYFFFVDARQHSHGANIAFIIDSSETLSKGRLINEFVVRFFTTLIRNSDVENFEAAILFYSTQASVRLNFNDKLSVQRFIFTINSLRHVRSSRRIDKALQFASRYIFTWSTLSRRQNIPNIALLITDGQTSSSHPDFVPMSEASKPLKRKGVRIFVVGIGLGVNQQQLFYITERSNDLVILYSWSHHYSVLGVLVRKVLSAIGKCSGKSLLISDDNNNNNNFK